MDEKENLSTQPVDGDTQVEKKKKGRPRLPDDVRKENYRKAHNEAVKRYNAAKRQVAKENKDEATAQRVEAMKSHEVVPQTRQEIIDAMVGVSTDALNLDDTRKGRSAIVKDVVKWTKLPAVQSDDELRERMNIFFEAVAQTGEIPTFEKLCLACGTTTRTFDRWQTGEYGSVRKDLCDRAKAVVMAIDAELAATNRMPVVDYIFRAKNFYGMKDQQDLAVQNRDNDSEGISAEDLKNKYRIRDSADESKQ